MELKIYNEAKTEILNDYDIELGYLKADRIFIAHHEATEEIQEQSHIEVIAEYPNGGKDVKEVIDVPYSPAKEAWDEYEDIQVYIPFTVEELVANKERDYKVAIVTKIRERYSLDDELAIARQRDTKPEEWAGYNAYCEECKAQAKNELANKE